MCRFWTLRRAGASLPPWCGGQARGLPNWPLLTGLNRHPAPGPPACPRTTWLRMDLQNEEPNNPESMALEKPSGHLGLPSRRRHKCADTQMPRDPIRSRGRTLTSTLPCQPHHLGRARPWLVGCWVVGGCVVPAVSYSPARLWGAVPSALGGLASGFGMGSGRCFPAMTTGTTHPPTTPDPWVGCGGGWCAGWVVNRTADAPNHPALFCFGGVVACHQGVGTIVVRAPSGVGFVIVRVCRGCFPGLLICCWWCRARVWLPNGATCLLAHLLDCGGCLPTCFVVVGACVVSAVVSTSQLTNRIHPTGAACFHIWPINPVV